MVGNKLVVYTMGNKGGIMDIGIGSCIGKGMVVIHNSDSEVGYKEQEE